MAEDLRLRPHGHWDRHGQLIEGCIFFLDEAEMSPCSGSSCEFGKKKLPTETLEIVRQRIVCQDCEQKEIHITHK